MFPSKTHTRLKPLTCSNPDTSHHTDPRRWDAPRTGSIAGRVCFQHTLGDKKKKKPGLEFRNIVTSFFYLFTYLMLLYLPFGPPCSLGPWRTPADPDRDNATHGPCLGPRSQPHGNHPALDHPRHWYRVAVDKSTQGSRTKKTSQIRKPVKKKIIDISLKEFIVSLQFSVFSPWCDTAHGRRRWGTSLTDKGPRAFCVFRPESCQAKC